MELEDRSSRGESDEQPRDYGFDNPLYDTVHQVCVNIRLSY